MSSLVLIFIFLVSPSLSLGCLKPNFFHNLVKWLRMIVHLSERRLSAPSSGKLGSKCCLELTPHTRSHSQVRNTLSSAVWIPRVSRNDFLVRLLTYTCRSRHGVVTHMNLRLKSSVVFLFCFVFLSCSVTTICRSLTFSIIFSFSFPPTIFFFPYLLFRFLG